MLANCLLRLHSDTALRGPGESVVWVSGGRDADEDLPGPKRDINKPWVCPFLPVTVSKQLSQFLNKAFTTHHHPDPKYATFWLSDCDLYPAILRSTQMFIVEGDLGIFGKARILTKF